MFTGIVTRARVKQFEKDKMSARLALSNLDDATLGESVAVNGACLTVAELDDECAHFFISDETLARTNFGDLSTGASANIERALKLSDRLSGHWVQGHVDGVGQVLEIDARDGGHDLKVSIPNNLSKYCVEKGSICVDGVSLTINQLDESGANAVISLRIVPHTWEHTRMQDYKKGSPVNIEVDLLAKYVEKLCRN